MACKWRRKVVDHRWEKIHSDTKRRTKLGFKRFRWANKAVEDQVGWGVEDRAKMTLPDGFAIKESPIDEAGLGVFPTKLLRKHTLLGPYQGVQFKMEEADDVDVHYTWHVTRGAGDFLLDGSSESTSNWLRYINHPIDRKHENLKPKEVHGELYYYSIRDIEAGEELLIWYGQEFHENLLDSLDKLKQEQLIQTSMEGSETIQTCPVSKEQEMNPATPWRPLNLFMTLSNRKWRSHEIISSDWGGKGKKSDFERNYGFHERNRRMVPASDVNDCFEKCERDSQCVDATLVQTKGSAGNCFFTDAAS